MDKMVEVRKGMIKVLTDYGYETRISKMTRITSYIDSYELSFEVRSANPRRYEICVGHYDHSGFNVATRQEGNVYVATTRFRKDDSIKSIMAALNWVAKAHVKHAHLDALINSDTPLPTPYTFASGNAPICSNSGYYHAYIGRCQVLGIVIVSGRELAISSDYREDGNPMFLMRIYITVSSHSSILVLTDGDTWLPVWEYRRGKYVVFEGCDEISSLRSMNATDQGLIRHAIGDYGARFLAE